MIFRVLFKTYETPAERVVPIGILHVQVCMSVLNDQRIPPKCFFQ